MGLRLIIGPAAGGKTSRAAQEIADKLKKNDNSSIIYLTPEQETLKAELMLMQRMGINSLLGMPVFGFKRLAYAVFEEVGAPKVTWMDDVGKSMILQRVARENQKELQYFQRSVAQKGFIDRLKMMITEIIQYRLDENALRDMAAKQPEGSVLRAKLSDIALLYEKFNEYTLKAEGDLKASEQLLDELAPVLQHSSLICNADIYIDGFTGFTPQQYRVIEEMLKHAHDVTVTLSINEKAWKTADQMRSWRDLNSGLYFTAQKTFAKLSELSRDLGTKREIIYVDEAKKYRPDALRHTVDWLCEISSPRYPYKQGEKECPEIFPVKTRKLRSLEEEADTAMREILRLVRDGDHAYRDISVVVPNLENYARPLQRWADMYNIPLFIDDKADVRLTPMVQWIEAVCSLITSGFSQQAFISVLKTGLTGLMQETVDRIENTALSENWVGKAKILEGLAGFDEQQARYLQEFADSIERSREAQGYTEAIKELAEKQNTSDQLSAMADELRAEGDLLAAMQYDRIREQIMVMTTQLCSILGGIEISFDEYAAMLKIGISQCRLGQLPATLDEVSVGDLRRSKNEGSKVIFFLGFQGADFPSVSSGGSLLNDAERSRVGRTMEIAQGSREDLMEQYYLLQMAMGKASEKVCFLFHQSDEEGEEDKDASLAMKLEAMFGKEMLELPGEGKAEDVSLTVPMFFEDREKSLLLSRRLSDDLPEAKQMAGILESGKKFSDGERALDPAIASFIMDPTRKQLSISQLERYASCPYQYFLQYGLDLKERDVPEVTALEDGTVLHDLLCEAGEYLKNVLSEEEAEELAKELAESREDTYRVYQTSGRYRYFWQKLQQKAAYSLRLLSRQASLSDFEHKDFEWRFADEPGCGDPVEVRLKDGSVVRLQGKIDRVDIWQGDQGRYIQIIDYKTGSVSFDKAKVYNGLQLQLPVYLEAGMNQYDAKPAGFFYFHLTPSMINGSDLEAGKDYDQLVMEGSRLNGLLLKDKEVAMHMDKTLVDGRGRVINAGMTKAGEFNGKIDSELASPEQFDRLQDLIHDRISKTAERMQKGDITREPVGSGDNLPCKYCSYRLSCPRDVTVPGTRTRNLIKIGAKEFWNQLEKDFG